MKKEIREKFEKFYQENSEAVKAAVQDGKLLAEFNAVVAEAVNTQIKTFDFTDFLINTSRAKANEKVYLSVLGKVNVYSASTTSDVMKQVWKDKKYLVPRIPLVAQYEYKAQEIASGFLPATEEMIDELTNQLQVEIQKVIVNTVRAATAGPYTINTNAANFENDLNNAIDSVLDNTLTGQCYLVGRRWMLRNVANLGASESTKEEKDKYGIIARYHDADLKAVPKVGRGNEALMGENELFIAAPDCGKAVYYGDVEQDEIKPDVFVTVIGLLQEFGVSIIPEFGRIYRLVLS